MAIAIGWAQLVIGQIAKIIGGELNRIDLINLGALPYSPGEPGNLLADNSKLREGTGWKQRISLEDGLRQTVAWWKSQQKPGRQRPL